MSSREQFLLNPVKKETYGDIGKDNPDVLLLCPHDADSKKFLKVYPEIVEPYQDNPKVLDDFFQLERDIGSYQLALQTAKELIKISRAKLRIDLIYVAEIPRAVIDANRVPHEDESVTNPSGVHISPIRKVFDHATHPELVKEFHAIHRSMIKKIRTALKSLLPHGVFFDVHCMNDHDPLKTDTAIKEGPSPKQLEEYIRRLTLAEFQGRKRSVNILTRFVDQPIIANEILVGNLESALNNSGITTERDHPYSYLDFSMCSHYALENPNKGTTVDFPIREISEDGQADNVSPKLDNSKIKTIARINAESIYYTIPIAKN